MAVQEQTESRRLCDRCVNSDMGGKLRSLDARRRRGAARRGFQRERGVRAYAATRPPRWRTLVIRGVAGVMVGAHVAYRDLADLGAAMWTSPRRTQGGRDVPDRRVEGHGVSVGAQVRYVNRMRCITGSSATKCRRCSEAIRSVDESLAILTQLPWSGCLAAVSGRCSTRRSPTARTTRTASLVSRRLPDAVIADPAEVARAVHGARA